MDEPLRGYPMFYQLLACFRELRGRRTGALSGMKRSPSTKTSREAIAVLYAAHW